MHKCIVRKDRDSGRWEVLCPDCDAWWNLFRVPIVLCSRSTWRQAVRRAVAHSRKHRQEGEDSSPW